MSPACNEAAAWSQAEERAGSGSDRTSAALSLSAVDERAAPRCCVAAHAERGGEFSAAAIGHSRLPSATTEMTGVAGSHAPLRVDGGFDHPSLSRDDNLRYEPCPEASGERGHGDSRSHQLAARDRRGDLAPATTAGIDETRRDHLHAVGSLVVCSLVDEGRNFVELVAEVGCHRGDVAHASIDGEVERRHSHRVGQQRRPGRTRRQDHRRQRSTRLAERSVHGALRDAPAQPQCACRDISREDRRRRHPDALECGALQHLSSRPATVAGRERRHGLDERDAPAVGSRQTQREHEEQRCFVDVNRWCVSQTRRPRCVACLVACRGSAELREERRVADHDVERAVGQVRCERVGDLDQCLSAEQPPALGHRPRVGVDADDVARAAQTTGRGDKEVARAARRVEDADRARVEPRIEKRLQRPVEQVLDEERWGVECAEPTAFVGS